MLTEISVYLPNIPGQFSRVLGALSLADVSVRGFSVDRTGALSQLRLLFTDAPEVARAKEALSDYSYEPVLTEVLLLSYPDGTLGLLKITDALAENNINVDYAYPVLGQTAPGEVLCALKVEDGKAAYALMCLATHGITEHLAPVLA